MQELPEFIKWPSFQEVMAAETSLEEADAAHQALKDILSTMNQPILQEVTSLTEHIAEKVQLACGCVQCTRLLVMGWDCFSPSDETWHQARTAELNAGPHSRCCERGMWSVSMLIGCFVAKVT